MPLESELKARLRSLRDDAKRGRITLVLGAGVSRSRNVPTWQSLTEQMWQRYRNDDPLPWGLNSSDKQFLESVRTELGTSADSLRKTLTERLTLHTAGTANSLGFQMAFEILRERLNARQVGPVDEFADSLRELLYAQISPPRPVGDTADTLSALATLIRQEQASTRSRILRVITFNVDDLLEYEVHQGVEAWRATPVIWPIARPSNHIRSDAGYRKRPPIPCYHLHGYLPREAEWHEDAPESLVFTDAQYWASVSSPMSFANKIMSHALHDSHCIFIGLSMTDINLIRWLGTSYNEICDDKRKLYSRRANLHDRLAESLQDILSQGLTNEDVICRVTEAIERLQRNSESEVRRSQDRSLARHVWVRTKSTDTLLTEFLRLRGVHSIDMSSWEQLPDVLAECFPRLRGTSGRSSTG